MDWNGFLAEPGTIFRPKSPPRTPPTDGSPQANSAPTTTPLSTARTNNYNNNNTAITIQQVEQKKHAIYKAVCQHIPEGREFESPSHLKQVLQNHVAVPYAFAVARCGRKFICNRGTHHRKTKKTNACPFAIHFGYTQVVPKKDRPSEESHRKLRYSDTVRILNVRGCHNTDCLLYQMQQQQQEEWIKQEQEQRARPSRNALPRRPTPRKAPVATPVAAVPNLDHQRLITPLALMVARTPLMTADTIRLALGQVWPPGTPQFRENLSFADITRFRDWCKKHVKTLQEQIPDALSTTPTVTNAQPKSDSPASTPDQEEKAENWI